MCADLQKNKNFKKIQFFLKKLFLNYLKLQKPGTIDIDPYSALA